MGTGNPPLDQAVTAMLAVLNNYLPPAVAPVPAPSVSAVSITERSAGLGSRLGMKTHDTFPLVALKGVRLDALVRFYVWAANPSVAERVTTALITRLMADRDLLWASGVYKLALEASLPGESIDSLGAWRKAADFRVLFEFHFEDSDGAESLIARIPVASDLEVKDSPGREITVITDEMARWDNEAAPALVCRGPVHVRALSALTFLPVAPPSGSITLIRTFDGATGAPTSHANLPDFMSAITRPVAPDDHAVVAFASLTDFLAVFTNVGDPAALGDWNLDGVADMYQARVLTLEPPIQLSKVGDRLEIGYQNTNFDQVAVVYLRLNRG